MKNIQTAIRTVLAVLTFLSQLASLPAAAQQAGLYFENDVITPAQLTNPVAGADKANPQWLTHLSHPVKWAGGVYRWYFNPANLPKGLTADQVVSAMQEAGQRWSQVCNVALEYMGQTTAAPAARTSTGPDRINVVGFADFAQFGMDNRSAGLAFPWPDSAYGPQSPVYMDGDIALNPNTLSAWTPLNLDSVLNHELGHVLGLAHSNIPSAIMSAAPYHTSDYNQRLHGDDADGCSALYGASAKQQTNRVLNWAETAFAKELNNAGRTVATQEGYGYVYRYYPGSKAYAGTKDGHAFYMGPDGRIQDLGLLAPFADQARAAGF